MSIKPRNWHWCFMVLTAAWLAAMAHGCATVQKMKPVITEAHYPQTNDSVVYKGPTADEAAALSVPVTNMSQMSKQMRVLKLAAEVSVAAQATSNMLARLAQCTSTNGITDWSRSNIAHLIVVNCPQPPPLTNLLVRLTNGPVTVRSGTNVWTFVTVGAAEPTVLEGSEDGFTWFPAGQYSIGATQASVAITIGRTMWLRTVRAADK